nr:hypothetical protein [Candidatus Sigynarchaeum springense]
METKTLLVGKGTYTSGKLSLSEASVPLDDAMLSRLIAELGSRIPTVVLNHADKPRTMLFDDVEGYNFIKFFPVGTQVNTVLVRITGIIYNTDEIKKVSIQLAQYLDANLDLATLTHNILLVLAAVDAYDFSRPIRTRFGMMAWLSDDDRSKRGDEILPVLNRTRYATSLTDRIMFTKLDLLMRHKDRVGSSDDPQVINLIDGLVVALDAASPAELSTLDKGIVCYNLALVLRELGHLKSSSRLFAAAEGIFSASNAQRLEIFAGFNVAINSKQANDWKGASEKIAALRPMIQETTLLSDTIKGIFYRHDGETCQALKDIASARTAFAKGIECFQRAKQGNIDSAICYFGRGTIDFNDEAYFDACKNFTFATNILGLLGQDTSKVTRNLGISYFNLAREYAVAIKILEIERDASRAVDMVLKGLGFIFLAHFYVGTEISEKVKEVIGIYSNLCGKALQEELPPNDKEVATQLYTISQEYAATLAQTGIDHKTMSKYMFEKIRNFQPLQVYYLLIIFKGNGLSIFSKESKALSTMPKMDENLIAGMISGITSFLTEVLSGEQQLSLLDRDNVKILFEYSPNLMGMVFANKESPKLRQELKEVLATTERDAKEGLQKWTGDVKQFAFIEQLAAKFME